MTARTPSDPSPRRRKLPPEVEAAISRYRGTSGLAETDPDRFNEAQELVRDCVPLTVERAEALLATVTRFVVDMPPPSGVPVTTWLDRPRGERWLHTCDFNPHAFKNKRGLVRQLADVAAGIAQRPARSATGPNLPTLDAERMSALLDVTADDPGARWSLIAAASAGVISTETILFTRVGAGLFVQTADGVVRQILEPIPDDVDLVGRVGPEDWQALRRCARDVGVTTRVLGPTLQRTWRLALFNSNRPFVDYVRAYSFAERAVEGVLQQLDPVEWAVASRPLRGEEDSTDPGSHRASAPVPSRTGKRPGGSVPKRTSRAAAQRAAASARKRIEHPELPDHLEQRLKAFVPREVDPAVWAQVRPDHHLIMRRSNSRGTTAFDHNCSTLARYLAHRASRGLPTAPADAMTDAAINAYVITGLFDVNEGTAATYTSRLRRLAKHANPSLDAVPQPSSFSYTSVHAPYTAAEEAAIRRVALRQRRPKTRRELCILVGLGGGAGLSPTDLRFLRAHHIVDHGDEGIEVNVPSGRRVMVRRPYEEVVRAGLTGLAPKALVLGTKPTRRNITSGVLESAEIFDDVPSVDMARLRTTWLTWLIGRPVPLRVILDAAGLTSARTLISLLPYVADTPSDADLLRGDQP